MINYRVFFNFPRSLFKLVKDVLLNKDQEVSSYNKVYSAVLYWYYWASDCIMTYGKNGYAYEYSLGRSLQDTFFQTYFGYGLLLKFAKKPYQFINLTIFVIIASCLCLFLFQNHIIYGLLFLTFIAASPLFIYSIVHTIKPEAFAWVFFLWTMFSVYHHNYIITSILYLIATMFSITLFVLILSVFSIGVLIGLFSWQNYLFICLPSGLYLVYHLISFFRYSNVKDFAKFINNTSQAKKNQGIFYRIFFGNQRDLQAQIMKFLWITCHMFFIAILIFLKVNILSIVLMLALILTAILNECIVRYSDHHTFLRMSLCSLILVNIFNPNLIIFLSALGLLYLENEFYTVFGIGLWVYDHDPIEFPFLTKQRVFTKKIVNKLDTIFKDIKANERTLFEINGDFFSAASADIRFLNVILDYYLKRHHCSALPEEYFHMDHSTYVNKFYNSLNVKVSIEEIITTMKETGSRYIICYTEGFIKKIAESGHFSVIGELSVKDMPDVEFGRGVNENIPFTFFKLNEKVEIIEECEKYEFAPNLIKITGRPHSECIIKITYHKKWRIKNGDGQLERINYNGLNYIKVIFETSKDLVLRFVR